MNSCKKKFERRRNRVRSKILKVSSGRVRLSVHKSNSYIYAQVIDDASAITIVSASSLEKEFKKVGKSNCNIPAAAWVGSKIAERASAAGVLSVVFDKGGNKYHGVVKALAEAARHKLQF